MGEAPGIWLPATLAQQILEHTRATAPNEAVGLIGGHSDGHAVVVIPLPNLAGERAFLADPHAQFLAERRIAGAGLEIIAIYHSHPGGGLGFSAADRSFASPWACTHIVIVPGRAAGDDELMRAYGRGADDFVAVPIHVLNG